MKVVRIALLSATVLLAGGSGLSWGWSPVIHARLADSALSLLSPELNSRLATYREQILAGAATPPADMVWNSHAELKGDGPDRIEAMFSEILSAEGNLANEPEQLAYALGRLAGAVADMSYPLHTDERVDNEPAIQSAYDADTEEFMPVVSSLSRNVRYWVSPRDTVIASASRANHFYAPVIAAYSAGEGYDELAGITTVCSRQAVQDIADAWTTLWAKHSATNRHALSIALNRAELTPGDTLVMTVSVVAGGDLPPQADLYVAIEDDVGMLYFLTATEGLSPYATPLKERWNLAGGRDEELLSLVVPPKIAMGSVGVFALLVTAGGSPYDAAAWASNLSFARVVLAEHPVVELSQLKAESYLFPAISADGQARGALPLQRWDFIFVGDMEDNPATSRYEPLFNILIPGEFNHVMVYLGRDADGKPWGMEMTTTGTPQSNDLRIVRLPEFEDPPIAVEGFNLAVGPKSLSSYQPRWAMRLNPSALAQVRQVEPVLLQILEKDWQERFPYQLEFDWSGRVTDSEIQLVDDGRARGASCTDYWLALYEEVAGVCIRGTRISAADLKLYFTSDQEGSTAMVPEELNPFPFPLSMQQALAIGFRPVDPPAHYFPCGGPEETGVPIPDKLRHSPQLIEIAPVPLPPSWQ